MLSKERSMFLAYFFLKNKILGRGAVSVLDTSRSVIIPGGTVTANDKLRAGIPPADLHLCWRQLIHNLLRWKRVWRRPYEAYQMSFCLSQPFPSAILLCYCTFALCLSPADACNQPTLPTCLVQAPDAARAADIYRCQLHVAFRRL